MLLTNYRQFFDDYFANESKFMIERDLEGAFEKHTIRASLKSEKLLIEIIYVADNGKYEHLHHLRFKHPKSVGFAHWQNQQKTGFGNRFEGFSQKKLADLQILFEERLKFGWEECFFYKDKQHYKSKITLFSIFKPKMYVWRRNKVSLQHLVLSSFFGGFYRKIKKGFETRSQLISCDFFLRS
jgi:hypothetical protein